MGEVVKAYVEALSAMMQQMLKALEYAQVAVMEKMMKGCHQ